MKTLRIAIALLALTFSVFVHAGPVNINTANAQSLSKNIKGIGLKKAEAIIAYREKHGEFKTVADLTKVKGIGNKLLEKNKGLLIIKKPGK
ncbi:MAG: helix-hairpin-helix domain-containing protein [Gammaproteobacteria bacterium]|nr:helix-hairpin-helix domain-containing protein [Gammaproteobacteria bacterium]